jgi:DNA-binding transcriptional ArsR family regulator
MTRDSDTCRVPERDLAPIATLIGDPTRITMLAALTEGRALPAGDLARRAGIRPATASAHLHRLIEGGLVAVRIQGRHRYHELAGPQVAAVIEALAQLAPAAPVASLRSDRAAARLSEARTCYDHLAGRRGVELRDRLRSAGALVMIDERDHELTDAGRKLMEDLGLVPGELHTARRVFARSCLDWTHRRPHLAGALPAAITHRFLELGWVSRGVGRQLQLAPNYEQCLDHWCADQAQAR